MTILYLKNEDEVNTIKTLISSTMLYLIKMNVKVIDSQVWIIIAENSHLIKVK